jgi:hypothetical protein
MPIYEPSLRLMNSLLNAETRNVLSCSLAALVIGALSQVEATMELTNRVCDRYVAFQIRQTHTLSMKSDFVNDLRDASKVIRDASV